jgi:NAD/NADP transhydrogenase alpha subunit
MLKISKALGSLSDLMDRHGYLAMVFLIAQFYLVYFMVDWAKAFGSTALATKADLMGAAAIIGAVSAVPQALLMLATNKYIEMRTALYARNTSIRTRTTDVSSNTPVH